MDVKIREILEPKTKSPALLKTRSAYMYRLYTRLESNATDLSFLNNKRAVMDLVRDSDNLGTQKTRLFHIVETIRAAKDKSVKPEVKEYYAKRADELKKPVAQIEATKDDSLRRHLREMSYSGTLSPTPPDAQE